MLSISRSIDEKKIIMHDEAYPRNDTIINPLTCHYGQLLDETTK